MKHGYNVPAYNYQGSGQVEVNLDSCEHLEHLVLAIKLGLRDDEPVLDINLLLDVREGGGGGGHLLAPLHLGRGDGVDPGLEVMGHHGAVTSTATATLSGGHPGVIEARVTHQAVVPGAASDDPERLDQGLGVVLVLDPRDLLHQLRHLVHVVNPVIILNIEQSHE